MTEHTGIAISAGLAEGTIFFVEDYDFSTVAQTTNDVKAELKRLHTAMEQTALEINELYEKATHSADESVADIFMIHQLMLQDEDFLNGIETLISKEKCSAEVAVSKAAEEFSAELSDSGSDYIAERGADIADIAQHLIRILQGKDAIEQPPADQKIILAANEITPSLTLLFDKSQLIGFVSAKGSATCHAAILARSLGIPAVIIKNAKFDASLNNTPCLIDGLKGTVIFNPDKKQIKAMKTAQTNFEKEQEALLKLKDLPAVTKSGAKVELFCNAASLDDIDNAIAYGAEGIGLFRSEFLYLGRKTLPSEDELTKVYTQAVEKLDGRKLVIRTLDIGADKQSDCIPMKAEANPVLGVRGLRLCFAKPDIFMVQLRAILRAASAGPVAIMFPMVASTSEITEAKRALEKAKTELKKDGIAYGEKLEVGIMVETPAAAVISDLLAKEVDFFSIGTNDLTQYTLAADRQNEDMDSYCDPHHEAVLRLIELTIKNAHAQGIWCGICGELGADLSLSKRFIDAGVDELSVVPSSLLRLKENIRNLS